MSRQNLVQFLEEKLCDRNYGPSLEWSDEDQRIFRIRWVHAGRPDYNESKDAKVFKDWCLLKGSATKNISDINISEMKARFRNAIRKSKYIKELPVPDEDDLHKYFRFVDEEKQNQQENIPMETQPGYSNSPHNVTIPETVAEWNPTLTNVTIQSNDQIVNDQSCSQSCQSLLSLEIRYKGGTVRTEDLFGNMWRICSQVENEFAAENTTELYGPSDAVCIILPNIPEIVDPQLESGLQNVKKALEGLRRGLVVCFDSQTCDIFVYRLCRSKVFFAGIGCTNEATSVNRREPTKVFCFRSFKRALGLYQSQQGPKPSPLVYLSFGQKWNTHWQIDKTVICAELTHTIAKLLVDEVAMKVNNSVELSSPDDLDKLLSSKMDQLRLQACNTTDFANFMNAQYDVSFS
ncbi:interferon regulatory factor 8-like [Tubulanus polymorphus]|uniref:interferon regulatory factor 8-like n=1 Tax=Tubulanus polymorphus TaxID=672921 RepID=UPI003DA3EC78